MDITSKTIVERFANEISVVVGDITTERGEVTFCWVERSGERVSNFTDIDTAMELATEKLWYIPASELSSSYGVN